jgi:sugar O-acyltransferase (sialic acid O-acetyltransferase NeuD family)
VYLDSQGDNRLEIILIDDSKDTSQAFGHQIMSLSELIGMELKSFPFTIAISDPSARKEKSVQLTKIGGKPVSLISNEATIYSDVKYGEGLIVMPGARISANVVLGSYVHVNFNSYIAHDVIVSDFVTFSPGVNCGGGVSIGREAFIGMGATIIQSTFSRIVDIGDKSVVGMGANVIKSVDAGKVVIGNPAREYLKD